MFLLDNETLVVEEVSEVEDAVHLRRIIKGAETRSHHGNKSADVLQRQLRANLSKGFLKYAGLDCLLATVLQSLLGSFVGERTHLGDSERGAAFLDHRGPALLCGLPHGRALGIYENLPDIVGSWIPLGARRHRPLEYLAGNDELRGVFFDIVAIEHGH